MTRYVETPHLITVRRLRLSETIEALPEEQKATIKGDLEEAKLVVNKLPDMLIKQYLRACVQLKYGIKDINRIGYYE